MTGDPEVNSLGETEDPSSIPPAPAVDTDSELDDDQSAIDLGSTS